MRFEEMFKTATGFDPYPYQCRLAESRELPSILDIPTGAGKTGAMVLSWLWKRRFAPDSVRKQTPRRLVYCLPMRSLVEQTRDNILGWLDHLNLLGGSIKYDDAEKKRIKSYSPCWADSGKIVVTVLMGGEDADRWDEYPERDAVIIGTQDMMISRALNRGYAMSRYRWPVHFGLLNNDVLWIMDETQLMGVGVETSAQLHAFRRSFGTYGPSATVWMSATVGQEQLATFDNPQPPGGWSILSLGEDDLRNPDLKTRYSSHKRLERADLKLTDESRKSSYGAGVADLVLRLHKQGHLTLVVLNNVKRAQDVYQSLIKKGRSEDNTGLLHSRFREPDRARGMNLLRSDGDRIIVSTQVVEAGVDASSTALITEIAPWPSLVQRFGRCNRFGEVNGATVCWIDIEASDEDDLALPYDDTDLNIARSILEGLDEVCPEKLREVTYSTRRVVRPVMRRKDLLDFFDTTSDLLGDDIDVSVYVRDGDDKDIQVYWRELTEGLPAPHMSSPHRSELCHVPVWDLNLFLKKGKAWRWDHLDSRWMSVGKGGEIHSSRPGMVLLIDCAEGAYHNAVGWTGPSEGSKKPIPVIPIQGITTDPDSSMVDEPESEGPQWVLLNQHLHGVSQEVSSIARDLDLGDSIASDLKTAALWHDVGKGHEAFQNMLMSGLPNEDVLRSGAPWAKSGPPRRNGHCFVTRDGKPIARRYFRHELASALSWLAAADGAPANRDLVAYLIASHHGKVRMSIRSLPTEEQPEEDILFARGIWQGDRVARLPGILDKDVDLDLSLMLLGEGSWAARTLGLRDNSDYGPFRMALAESVVRVADWRVSSRGVVQG